MTQKAIALTDRSYTNPTSKMTSNPREVYEIMTTLGIRDAFLELRNKCIQETRVKPHRRKKENTNQVTWEALTDHDADIFVPEYYHPLDNENALLFRAFAGGVSGSNGQKCYIVELKVTQKIEPTHIDVLVQQMRENLQLAEDPSCNLDAFSEYLVDDMDLGIVGSHLVYRKMFSAADFEGGKRSLIAQSVTDSLVKMIDKFSSAYDDSLQQAVPEKRPTRGMLSTEGEVTHIIADTALRDIFKYLEKHRDWHPQSRNLRLYVPEYEDRKLLFRFSAGKSGEHYLAVIHVIPRFITPLRAPDHIENITKLMSSYKGDHGLKKSLFFSYATTIDDEGYMVPFLQVALPFPAAAFEQGFRFNISPQIWRAIRKNIQKISETYREIPSRTLNHGYSFARGSARS